MFDFLTTPFANGPSVHPLELAVRLLTASCLWMGNSLCLPENTQGPGLILYQHHLIALRLDRHGHTSYR